MIKLSGGGGEVVVNLKANVPFGFMVPGSRYVPLFFKTGTTQISYSVYRCTNNTQLYIERATVNNASSYQAAHPHILIVSYVSLDGSTLNYTLDPISGIFSFEGEVSGEILVEYTSAVYVEDTQADSGTVTGSKFVVLNLTLSPAAIVYLTSSSDATIEVITSDIVMV